MRIVVIEQNQIGFGASGRNGGWCSGFMPTSLCELEENHGRSAAIEMFNQSFKTLDEIESVLKDEQIDCDYHRGGTINGATNSVQSGRLDDEIKQMREFGFGEEHMRFLTTAELSARLNIDGLQKVSYTPHCAAIHPMKLVTGLARTIENLGVEIFENTKVIGYAPREITTDSHICSADFIIRATEGYTAQMRRNRRTLAPLYSYMVATAPLSASQLSGLGWANRETYHDARRMIIYAQLTKDNRIAFGGRGAPYHFASRVAPQFDMHIEIHNKIIRSMHEVFNVTKDLEITHRWGGPLGVPRNWRPSVKFNPRTGLGSLGGYVGEGVAATNLAARTLAHLIIDDKHPLTELPWVNIDSQKWEIEPFRFIGINGLLKLSDSIDKHESKTNRPARGRSYILSKFLGD